MVSSTRLTYNTHGASPKYANANKPKNTAPPCFLNAQSVDCGCSLGFLPPPYSVNAVFRWMKSYLQRRLAAAGTLVHGQARRRRRVLAWGVWVGLFLLLLRPAHCRLLARNKMILQVYNTHVHRRCTASWARWAPSSTRASPGCRSRCTRTRRPA